MSARIRTSATATVAAALTISASLALTGCFGIPGVPGVPGAGAGSDQDAAENMLEGLFGQIGEGGGIDLDITNGELPEGFPADVPVTGTPTMGFGASDASRSEWKVVTETTGTADSVMAAVDSQLTGAGFSSESPGMYESDTYSIAVFTAEQDGVVSVNYTVVLK